MSNSLNKNNLLWSSATCDREFGFLKLTRDSLVFESNDHVPKKVIPFSSIENTLASSTLRKRITIILKGGDKKVVFKVPNLSLWKKNLSLIKVSQEYFSGKCKHDGTTGIISIMKDSLVFQQTKGGNKDVFYFDQMKSIRTGGILKRHLIIEMRGNRLDLRVHHPRNWVEILSLATQIRTTQTHKALPVNTQKTPGNAIKQPVHTIQRTPAPIAKHVGSGKLNLNTGSKNPLSKTQPAVSAGPSSVAGKGLPKPGNVSTHPSSITHKPIQAGKPVGQQSAGSAKVSALAQHRGSWPMGQDYDQAFQSPVKNINSSLGNVSAWEVVRNPKNQSMLVYAAGNFGSVYKVRLDDGKFYAIKCFTKKSTEINSRYEKISSYLEAHEGSRKFLVHFRYYKDGIRTRKSDTLYFPLLKMEWCDGVSLNNFISSNLKHPKVLKSVAETLVKDIASLQEIGIAHCDLSGDNIIINDRNEIFFVDYDGMFIPASRGVKAMEIGHADFQHPLRTRDDYSEKLDNFSTLVIYSSMLALAEKPSLWKDFNDDNPDRLIFGKRDFRDIKHSKVAEEIKKTGDKKLVRLCTLLEEAVEKPVLWEGDSPKVLLSM